MNLLFRLLVPLPILLVSCGKSDEDPGPSSGAGGTGTLGNGSGTGAAPGSGGTSSGDPTGTGGAAPTPILKGDPACNVSLSRADFYQGIRVPLVEAGAPSDREVDIIQGKPGLLRLYFQEPPGKLGARVTFTTGGKAYPFEAVQTISVPGDDASLESTLNIDVSDGDALGPDTTYSIELLNPDGPCSGDTSAARFPISGDQELLARATGAAKVFLIPMRAGGVATVITDDDVALYKRRMEDLFPAKEAIFRLRSEPFDVSAIPTESNFDTILDELCWSQFDDPDADLAETWVGLYEADGPISGVLGKMSVPPPPIPGQLGFGSCGGVRFEKNDAARGVDSLLHEVGHALNLNHAPCGGAMLTDPDFPDPSAAIGSWGYRRSSQELVGPDTKDFMSYCGPDWTGPFHFKKMADWLERLNFIPAALSTPFTPEAPQPFRRALVQATGPAAVSAGTRWIASPERLGKAEQATAFNASGKAVKQFVVYSRSISHSDSVIYYVPEPKPDWAYLGVGSHRIFVSGEAP